MTDLKATGAGTDIDVVAAGFRPANPAFIAHPYPVCATLRELIVKMDELHTNPEQRGAAERTAGEFIHYIEALIVDRRREPRGDLVSGLVAVADQGDRLTGDEIICTVIVAERRARGDGQHDGQWSAGAARRTGGVAAGSLR